LGELGTIHAVRAAYQMAFRPPAWRSTKAQAGSGVLADIGSHLIHMVELGRSIAASRLPTAASGTIPPPMSSWSAFLAEFSSGAAGPKKSHACPGRGANIFAEVYDCGQRRFLTSESGD
jgi:predicted dehydrogenase